MSVAVIACGAIATHIFHITSSHGLDVTIYPLPPLLHNQPAKIAGEVKFGDGPDLFNPDTYIDQKEQKKMDRFIHFAIAGAEQAIADSGWKVPNEEQAYRTGVMIGSGIGGLPSIQKTAILAQEKGAKRISPFFIPASLINLASGQVSIKHQFMGPNHAVVTACATGSHAIGDSARMIAFGDVDVMVAGGAESAICESGIGGFAAPRAYQLILMTTQLKVHALGIKDVMAS